MIIEAKENDLALAVPLLQEMQAEHRTLGRVNPAHFTMSWRARIASGRGLVLLSVDPSGECDGVLCGALSNDDVTGVLVYQMGTAYAKRGHVKAAMPMIMLRKAERWAKDNGARVMFCGSLAGDDRGTVKFLTGMGYKPSDQAFVKGLK